jgi:hypothetical protein
VNTRLLEFYLDQGTDSRGRMLREILAWEDPAEWERCHDFIQWVFPLPEPSRFNPNAPLLDEDTLEAFRSSSHIQVNIAKAYVFAQRFLWNKGVTWLQPGDHNHLRITRIIRFLNLTGNKMAANHVYKQVVQLAKTEPEAVSDFTLEFWRQASISE